MNKIFCDLCHKEIPPNKSEHLMRDTWDKFVWTIAIQRAGLVGTDICEKCFGEILSTMEKVIMKLGISG